MTDTSPANSAALAELRRRAESELEAAEAYHRFVLQLRAAWRHALRHLPGQPDDPPPAPGWNREELLDKLSQSEEELEWAARNLARVRNERPRLRLV